VTARFLSSQNAAILNIVDDKTGRVQILDESSNLDDSFIQFICKHIAQNDGCDNNTNYPYKV
jgi:hypothetical protein